MHTKNKTHWFTILILLLVAASLLWWCFEGGAMLYRLRGWPESLVELYKRNPEARDFVKGWSSYTGLQPIDLSGDVVPGEIPHFLQWDPRWGYERYGSDFLAITGCGPTCLAMVYCGLTGETDQNPCTLARYTEEQGWYVPGAGTAWTMLTEGGTSLGLSVRQLALTEGEIGDSLRAGRVLICSMLPGDFTRAGHFIVLTGIDAAENVTLLDPNSRQRSERSWPLSTLLSQMAAAWEYTL